MSTSVPQDPEGNRELEIVESLPPEGDGPSIGKVPTPEKERARLFILWITLPLLAITVIFALCSAIYRNEGNSVEHIVSLVVAAVGPVIGFYFAEESKK